MEWILVLGLTMPIIRMLLQSEMKFEGSSDLGIAALQPTAAIVHSSSLLSDMIGTPACSDAQLSRFCLWALNTLAASPLACSNGGAGALLGRPPEVTAFSVLKTGGCGGNFKLLSRAVSA
jgi:hypothetical protein